MISSTACTTAVLKYFLTILLYCCQPALGMAQQTPVEVEEVIVVTQEDDTDNEMEEDEILNLDTIIAIRSIAISADSIRLLKKELSYLTNLDSLLDATQRKKETSTVQKPSMNVGSPDTSLLKGLMWILAIAFVGFVAYQLLQNKGLFKGNSRKLVTAAVEEPQEEDLLDMNINQLLQKATEQENYTLATRYQFIKTLQLLNDKQLIDFAADKTNRQYQYELPEKWSAAFSSLLLNYEYIWFGKEPIDVQLYEKISSLHNNFNARL